MKILSRLYASSGAKKKKKRVGRGVGSGHGTTSCRGTKGLLARSGGGLRHGFEGGQMPLIRRIPKRGFTRKKNNIYQIVNIESLNGIKDTDIITPFEMKNYGLVKNTTDPIKILGDGELSRPITIKSHAFSASAIDKIKKAGGKTEIMHRDTSSQRRTSKDEKKRPQRKRK